MLLVKHRSTILWLSFVLAILTTVSKVYAEPTISLLPAAGPPSTVITVSGRGFCNSCGPVTLSIRSLVVTTAPVDKNGNFSVAINAPSVGQGGEIPIYVGQTDSSGNPIFAISDFNDQFTQYPDQPTTPNNQTTTNNQPVGSNSVRTNPASTNTLSTSPKSFRPAIPLLLLLVLILLVVVFLLSQRKKLKRIYRR